MQLNKATPTNFELTFPKIPIAEGIHATEELTLNIFETIIPSVSLDVVEKRWLGAKVPLNSGDMTFEPWNVNFVVDSDFTNWKTLFKWLASISNNSDKFAGIREDYIVDARLRVVDNFRRDIFQLKFIGVWPTMLTEVNLTKREAEPNLEAMVNLAYVRYELIEV